MSDLKRIYKVGLPFDKKHTDPSKNYGIGGLCTTFILKGDKGAVQFSVGWPCYLPHVDYTSTLGYHGIYGYDVGYHSLTPLYDGQTSMDCDLLGCGKCYYDGSSLRASEWVERIFQLRDPEPVMWRMLEQEYKDRFNEEDDTP